MNTRPKSMPPSASCSRRASDTRREIATNGHEEPTHDAPLERLPVLFCSPTMELGVDISALNTRLSSQRAANTGQLRAAQWTRRSFRSGGACSLTYCAAQSPHDQWFFSHAREMVHGVVKAPTLDLANRDLIDSHIQAIWLSNIEHELDTSIAPLLELDKENKPLKADLRAAFQAPAALARARDQARRVIDTVRPELKPELAPWFSERYVDTVVDQRGLSVRSRS